MIAMTEGEKGEAGGVMLQGGIQRGAKRDVLDAKLVDSNGDGVSCESSLKSAGDAHARMCWGRVGCAFAYCL